MVAWSLGQGFCKDLRWSVEKGAVGTGRGKQDEVLSPRS